MTDSSRLSVANPWFTTSVAIVVALVIVTALAGFVLLPYQTGSAFGGLWDAICSAAGVANTKHSQAAPVEPNFAASTVVLPQPLLASANQESIGRGATLAQQCAICHGPTGVSRADSPNLAGQYPSAIYKQLKDFKSGARVSSVMTPFALPLSDRDMVDLAAYYSYLPRLPAYHPGPPLETPPRIVINGAPLRGIAPCGSCHRSLDNKVGSPWLEGQSETYLKSQLQAFASSARRNDTGRQMRNVAQQMTAEEISQAVRYFASQPADNSF